jgi:hypothetical protein
MNEGETSRISGKLAKGIGGLTMVLGSALVLMAFFPVKQFLSGNKEWMDYLITLIAVTVMVIPGTLVILGGYQFYREVNLPNLKVLVGVYSAFGSLFCFSKVSDWYPDVWQQKMLTGGFIFGIAVFAIMIYLLALRWLVPATGMKWNGCRSVLGKGAFTLLAWLLFLALFPIAREVLPSVGLIVLLGPISVAWGLHILAVKWLKDAQQTPTP